MLKPATLLKKFTKNTNIIDIFILENNPIEIFIFIKKKDSTLIDKIKTELNITNTKFELKTLLPEDIFKTKDTLKILTSGFDIETLEKVSKKNKVKTSTLLTYGLENLNHSQKTLFGYALKGRKEGQGLIHEIKGKTIGRNTILIPFSSIEKITDFMKYWKISFTTKEIIELDKK